MVIFEEKIFAEKIEARFASDPVDVYLDQANRLTIAAIETETFYSNTHWTSRS